MTMYDIYDVSSYYPNTVTVTIKFEYSSWYSYKNKKKKKTSESKIFMNTKDWETPRNISASKGICTEMIQFKNMPPKVSVLLGKENSRDDAIQWVRESDLKLRYVESVIHDNETRVTFVFKKIEDAAKFKIVWG